MDLNINIFLWLFGSVCLTWWTMGISPGIIIQTMSALYKNGSMCYLVLPGLIVTPIKAVINGIFGPKIHQNKQ